MDDLEHESLISRIKRRKLFQWAIAYGAGAWLLLQLLSLLAQPFAWPNLVLKAAVVVLAVGFIAVLVLAWFHGEKGQQRASGIELLMLATLFIVAASGVLLVSRRGGKTDGSPQLSGAAVLSDDKSIAVLPFANLSADKENEYFADGITEDVLTNLSKIGGLRVISRTSVMGYKGTDKRVPQIAQELGVAHVLEGSVRRAGDQVRITAQLVRASNEQHLWADSYDRKVADIFAVQSEIARAIADALNARLSPSDGQRMAERPTESIEAYDLYMRGRAEYMTISSESGRRAVPLLRQAIDIDPRFGLATIFLARAYSFLSGVDVEAADSALVIAKRAVALAPNSADSYSALAEVLRAQGRYTEALEQHRRALQLNPNHAWSVAEMGEVLGGYGLGKLDEAIPLAERAISLDPKSGFIYNLLGDAHRQLGNYDDAAQAYERGLRADPGGSPGRHYLAILLLERGDTAAARSQIERILELDHSASFRATVAGWYASYGYADLAARYARSIPDSAMAGRATTYWYRGERPKSIAALTAYEQIRRHRIERGDDNPSASLGLAYAATMRGEEQAALGHLEDYFRKGGRDGVLITRHLLLAPLQNEPRMRALLERIRTDIAQQRRRLEESRRRPG